MKRIFSSLFALVLVLSFSLIPAVPVMADTIDLAVNEENPWTDGAFTFENISPGGDPMEFDFKLHNVGDDPGILTFSMSVSENDMAGAPAPNMSADEFASLIYVEAVHYQYIWLTDPENQPGGYIGSVRNDLDSWLDIDRYLGNDDGKVSLYELCGASPIPYGDYEGDQLEAGAEITYFIEFQLGDSLDPFQAGGDILTGVEDNSSQGDGVSVTIIATLEGTSVSDTEQSSGNVFQAFGVAGPVLNSTTDVTYNTIQEAIDAANPGDTIIVAAGTYNETVTIASDDHDLTLVGKGAIILGDGLEFGISLQAGTHHIIISGFEITGFDDFGYAAGIEGWTGSDKPDWTAGAIHHITIHHNNIHGNNDGINIGAWDWSAGSPPSWRHNNITIQHNVVSSNVDRGINLWAVSESNVNHNVIDDNGGNGLVFNHVSDSNANHNEIHGNDVVGLGVYNGATGNNFTNNDITNNDNLGILLTGWQYPTTGNTFIRNDAQGNGAWDIRCIQQWGSQVYGNKWVKNKYDDVFPDPPQ